jgi:hypothetical protein
MPPKNIKDTKPQKRKRGQSSPSSEERRNVRNSHLPSLLPPMSLPVQPPRLATARVRRVRRKLASAYHDRSLSNVNPHPPMSQQMVNHPVPTVNPRISPLFQRRLQQSAPRSTYNVDPYLNHSAHDPPPDEHIVNRHRQQFDRYRIYPPTRQQEFSPTPPASSHYPSTLAQPYTGPPPPDFTPLIDHLHSTGQFDPVSSTVRPPPVQGTMNNQSPRFGPRIGLSLNRPTMEQRLNSALQRFNPEAARTSPQQRPYALPMPRYMTRRLVLYPFPPRC